MRCKLSDICDYAIGKIDVVDLDNLNYISTENMLPNKGGITRATTLPTIKQTQEYQEEDILVSNIRPYFKKSWFATKSGGCSNDVLVFRAKAGIEPVFLYYILSADTFFEYSMATSKGTKMPRGDKKAIMKYPIPDYDLKTQKKIAYLLRDVDRKIAVNMEINKNLEDQAVTIFKQLLENGDSCIESAIGTFPSDFEVTKVGQIPMLVTDYVANGSFASLKANVTLLQDPDFAYFIRNTDLKSDSYNVYVDNHSYEFLAKSKLFGGEIIISNVGDVGSVFLCPSLNKPMTLGNNIIMLRPDDEKLRLYLYIWFKHAQGQSLIQGIKGGSAQPKFNKTDFKNLLIAIPSEMKLSSFNETVSPIFKAIDSNSTENKKLISLRDTLLPKLMSGKLDVSKIDI